jgi:FMN phosphatase YigB (HAD superfamily)
MRTPELVSFDVFDTVLTRAVARPESVFILLGNRLRQAGLTTATAAEFARARVAAEADVRTTLAGGECTIDDIYHRLKARGIITHDPASAAAAEVDIERVLVRRIPRLCGLMDSWRARGARTAFISDMYLSSSHIRTLLEVAGVPAADHLYVSNEHSLSKKNGLLRAACQSMNVRPRRAIHYGDNAVADMDGARRCGIRAVYVPDAHPNRFELLLESFAEASDGATALLAGASRLTRLGAGSLTRGDRAIWDVAAGVAAPILCQFTAWLLRRASDQGIERLYFIARDGQILASIARLLQPRLAPDLEIRYIYGSRRAWHLASITDDADLTERKWILVPADHLSVRAVCERLGVEPAAVAEPLGRNGFGADSYERPLSEHDKRRLQVALALPEFRQQVAALARGPRQLLMAYLEQEGLFSDKNWAMVDVGWRGNLQDSLADVLIATGRTPHKGFYFGLASDAGGDEGRGVRETFFCDRRREPDPGVHSLMYAFMEIFCSADHGTTIGYRADDNRTIVPILRHGGDAKGINVKICSVIQRAVLAFSQHWALGAGLPDPGNPMTNVLTALFNAFIEAPTPDEARAWGRWQYEDDQLGRYALSLAAPLSWRDVLRVVARGYLVPQHNSHWQEGAIAAMPRLRRRAYRAVQHARSIARSATQR